MKNYQFLVYLALGVLVFFIIKPYNFSFEFKDSAYTVGYSMPWTILWVGFGIIYLIIKQKNRAS
ncbi:hypothetical protein CLV48_102178 [Cecembia rubra]|uniref:Uncharacterized protein n=1 Tax=Cecembia rubra TaxID=1485585 RepID=A0A2P8EA59_9BACT|nr:hypothetical protein CLV48_102178 [Cecembia rubra]